MKVVSVFSIKHPDGLSFRKYLVSVAKPLSDIPLRVSEEGFLVRGLSPDKSVLAEVFMPPGVFEEYNVSGVNDLTIERDELLKILKRLGKGDSLLLKYEEGGGKVRAMLVNSRSGIERGYDVRVASLEGPIDPIQVELPISMRVETSIVQRLLKDAKLVGEELTITYSGDAVEFLSSSEGGEFRTVLERGKQLLELTSETKERVSSTYDIDLLKTATVALSAFDVALICFGPSLPLKISLTGEDGVGVTLWIASR
ncbi:MAG: hypothetical protein QW705_02865 [Zestosphaera sp.]